MAPKFDGSGLSRNAAARLDLDLQQTPSISLVFVKEKACDTQSFPPLP